MRVQFPRVRYICSHYCSRSKGASVEGNPALELHFFSALGPPY